MGNTAIQQPHGCKYIRGLIMYKDVLRSIEGIGIFPSISLLLFFTFFIVLVVYLIRKGKHHFDDAARLPLSNDDMNFKNSES